MFVAERGGGAFLNDRRMRVAARRQLTDCVISCGIPHLGRGHHGQALVDLRNVMADSAGIRRTRSAAIDLAYVAAGRFDAFWEDHLQPWDIAAGLLMVRESGGFASTREGGDDMLETGSIVVGNELVKAALLKTLQKPLK